MLKIIIVICFMLSIMSCKTDTGKAIGAAACKTQCPVVHVAAITGCEKLREKKFELYPLCVSEADAILLACSITCDLIKR